jgi:uncharacterized spore protein YtfJ
MTELENSQMLEDAIPAIETVQDTMDQFIAGADVDAVYAAPIEYGEQLIIPAAEVLGIMGFGVGSGGGQEASGEGGSGGGGGGGGRTFARPVAVIVASQTQVRVEPVVDVTKIAMAFFTAFAFVITTLIRMQRGKL